MTKRDYVAEITSRRSRLKRRAPRYDQVSVRLDGIIDVASFVRSARARDVPFRHELAKYVPIGMVACVEGYFRLVFRDLIDHGAPFRDNVAKFKELRLGLEHVIALQSRKVTLGEFVAHLLPAGSLEEINESMSILIGESFLDRFKNTKVEYFDQGKAVSIEEEGLSGAVIRDMKKLFEQRHIFAHELAIKEKTNPRSLAINSAVGQILIWGTEVLVTELLSTAT